MVTCTQCGKIKGHGEVGTNWICGDCKAGERGQTTLDAGGEEPEPETCRQESGQRDNIQ